MQQAGQLRRVWRRVQIVLEAIKFEHTIFALPFALMGIGLCRRGRARCPHAGLDSGGDGGGANRCDGVQPHRRPHDRCAESPHTPAGTSRWATHRAPDGDAHGRRDSGLCVRRVATELALFLAQPVALAIILGYSYSKRFTPLSHYWLGLSLGIAPSASWIAVRGTLELPPILLTLAVALWVAGFDILYSLQDYEFDKQYGLRSLPETLGKAQAIAVSRLSHLLCIGLFALAGYTLQVGWLYYVGVALAALMLAYEQSLVKPDDLSKLDLAFFTMNGYVSIGLFLFSLLERMWR
jgi:4-hydroxybenzoate polyprenyltransferase